MKPARKVTEWTLVLLNGEWVTISGRDQWGEPWFSSTVAEIDVVARTARTVSGRPYVFLGPHEPEAGLRIATLTLARHGFDLSTGTLEAITLEEGAEWLAGRAKKPSLSAEDMVRSEQNRARRIWHDLVWHRGETGWTDERVAQETGLPLEAVRRLHEGATVLKGVDLDDTEEAVTVLRLACPGWRL